MKKRKLLNFVLLSLLSISLISCGNKSKENVNSNLEKNEVVKEEVLTIIPEQMLVTDYMKEYLQGGDELFKDGMAFEELYWDDKVNEDLISKYDLSYENGKVYKIKDLYNINPLLYTTVINTMMSSANAAEKDEVYFANTTLMAYVQNYLSDVWMNKKDGEYALSPEFKELSPKNNFQNYLKQNKIEIGNIVYPTSANGLEIIAGATVINVPVIIEGTQDGKEFRKKVNLDIFFTVPKEIREGGQYELTDKNFEIMGVNISSDKGDLNGYNYHFNYENALKDYGIN